MKLLCTISAQRLLDTEAQLWGPGEAGGNFGGCFALKSCVDGGELHVIAASGEGWDHVSVSRRNRVPTWSEMEQVKRLFFRPDETAMQLHVPPSDHINVHPNVLHLWRPLVGEIPRPPAGFV